MIAIPIIIYSEYRARNIKHVELRSDFHESLFFSLSQVIYNLRTLTDDYDCQSVPDPTMFDDALTHAFILIKSIRGDM